MKVVAIYNSTSASSILAAAMAYVRFWADTLTLIDAYGKTEAQLDTAIDLTADNTIDRAYCLCITAATHAGGSGVPSVDQNIVNLEAKIKSTVVGDYAAVILIGDETSIYEAAWEDFFPSKAFPYIAEKLADDEGQIAHMIIGGFYDFTDSATVLHWQKTLDLGTCTDSIQPFTESGDTSSKQDVAYINTWTADAIFWDTAYARYLDAQS